jgi:hypothetical protein
MVRRFQVPLLCLVMTASCYDFDGYQPYPTDSGPLGGICESGMSTNIPEQDQCLTMFCCEEFLGCLRASSCRRCPTEPDVTGCSTNAINQAWIQCGIDNGCFP